MHRLTSFLAALVIGAILLLEGLPARSEAIDCSYDRAAMAALDVKRFDQELNSGWRTIGDRKGCEIAAADLIAEYRGIHSATLSDEDVRGLKWHEAQVRAASGDTARAIRLFDEARPPDDVERNLYADATIAFLKGDREGLLKARASYAAIPEPAWFARAASDYKAKSGETLTWPMNLGVVDGLVTCFGRPYSEAYSPACRAKPASEPPAS